MCDGRIPRPKSISANKNSQPTKESIDFVSSKLEFPLALWQIYSAHNSGMRSANAAMLATLIKFLKIHLFQYFGTFHTAANQMMLQKCVHDGRTKIFSMMQSLKSVQPTYFEGNCAKVQVGVAPVLVCRRMYRLCGGRGAKRLEIFMRLPLSGWVSEWVAVPFCNCAAARGPIQSNCCHRTRQKGFHWECCNNCKSCQMTIQEAQKAKSFVPRFALLVARHGLHLVLKTRPFLFLTQWDTFCSWTLSHKEALPLFLSLVFSPFPYIFVTQTVSKVLREV